MSLTCNFNVVGLHSSAQKIAQSAGNVVSHNRPLPTGSWSLPDSALPSREKIPSATLFKSLSESRQGTASAPDPSQPQLPSIAECAVHLELLQAFYYLRRSVLESEELDAVWEVGPDTIQTSTGDQTYDISSPALAERRARKWPFFNRLAALRFLDWLKLADSHLATTHSDPGAIDTPPLDILMAWHAWLLNPQSFRNFCDLHGYGQIRNVQFPWEGIVSKYPRRPESNTYYYIPQDADCSIKWKKHAMIDSKDWKFTMPDNTSTHIQPDTLKTNDLFGYLCGSDRAKLVHDMVADLLDANLSERDIGRVIGRTEDLNVTEDDFISNCCRGMPLGDTLTAADEIAASIERQSAFVDKMEKQLWIASPAVTATLQRAMERYNKFLKLLEQYPDATLSPTLDIDLVWHTHQCSASRYESDTRTLVGRFLDHNDKLGSPVLNRALEKTARLWRVRFGHEYDVCFCWDCQALLSAATEIAEHQRENGLCNMEGIDTESVALTVGDYLTYYRYMEVSRRLNRPIPRQRGGR